MDLAVQKREKFGKQAKALRNEGFIPAELYGHGLQNVHLAVGVKDFAKTFKEAGTNTVVTLMFEKEKRPALIYEVTRNAVTGDVAHVDFYQVRMDEKIKAKVPLEFVGEAPAIKEKGAVITRAMSDIEVEALPQDLPRSFVVDLTVLNDVNKSIYVRDLRVPAVVKVLVDVETAIATATPPAKEEVVEAPAAVDVAEVKVETEEKKQERAAAKTEKGEKPEKTEKPQPTGKTETAAKLDTK